MEERREGWVGWMFKVCHKVQQPTGVVLSLLFSPVELCCDLCPRRRFFFDDNLKKGCWMEWQKREWERTYQIAPQAGWTRSIDSSRWPLAYRPRVVFRGSY